MTQSVKCLELQYAALSSIPRIHTTIWVKLCELVIPVLGKKGQEVSWNSLASLVKAKSPGLVSPCLQTSRAKVIEEATHISLSTSGLHIQSHRYMDTHIHMLT